MVTPASTIETLLVAVVAWLTLEWWATRLRRSKSSNDQTEGNP